MEYRGGDILTYEGKYICQGVNTLGVVGAGLAKQLADRYPKLLRVYQSKNLVLGDAFGVDCGTHTILNIATQKELGAWKRPFNLSAFIIGLDKIDRNIKGPVAFPPIGCGLGGGNWKDVKEALEAVKNIEPIIYYLNDEIPF